MSGQGSEARSSLLSNDGCGSIGRNYADHAKELGNAVPKEPFFFLKPTSSYVDDGGVVEIPRGVDCHFEGEVYVCHKGDS